jgi:cytochrome c-type biogenesis protein CcmF
MVAEIGNFALILALAVALVMSVLPLWGARRGDPALMAIAAPAALVKFALVALAFAMLTVGYVVSDFSIVNVYQNSHSAKPMLYKVTGVWGNHEGSLLLWILVLALFSALIALFGRSLPSRLQADVLAVQGMIAVAFIAFILFTSNPFERLDPAPFEGRDLNPILQDIGLAVHPPLLYVGYVGFSVAFAFAVAALIDGRIDAVWARYVRPWTLTAWIFLTLGISMGSYWAYYELGWGGFWFWDPVENASLMPWLAGTALLHSTIVMEKRDALKIWTILLSILTFSLSLLGTFLVRSGVLTSVHAFATDPARGVVILFILVLFVGGSLALFAVRASHLKAGGVFAPVSREGALVFNNLFLCAATAAVLIGTLYPLALESVTGEKISVGPPFFNLTFLPLTIPLLIAIPFGQSLAWKRGDLLAVTQRIAWSIVLGVLVTVALFAWSIGGPVAAPLGIGLGVYLIAGAMAEIIDRSRSRGAGFGVSLRRAFGLPRSAWGTSIAHAGIGLTAIGIAATAWHAETVALMRPGDTKEVGAFRLTLERVVPREGPNYRDLAGRFTIKDAGRDYGAVESKKRVYTARNMPTTEAGLFTIGLGQVYVSLGDVEADGRIGVRMYWKPLVLLIWLGTLVMALGGALSLSDRRVRVGAPSRARSAAGPVPAPAE